MCKMRRVGALLCFLLLNLSALHWLLLRGMAIASLIIVTSHIRLVQLIRTRTNFGVTIVTSPDTPYKLVGGFMDAQAHQEGVGVDLATVGIKEYSRFYSIYIRSC